MQNSKRRRSKSPFRFRSSHSPSPSSRSGSGRSTPSINGVAVPLEEGKASPVKLSPSQTPVDRRSLASLASSGSAGLTPSSTMEGLNTPSLPKVITIKKCQLRKRPPESEVSGWGFVLRGTTSEFKSGVRVYTCHIELVKEGGAAQNAGIKEGDQIVGIDGIMVRDFDHIAVVKMFQTKDKLELALLPAKFKAASQVRITEFNQSCLNYMWALTMSIQSLEIVNVKLPDDVSPDIKLACFTHLPGLRHLAITHCGLEDLGPLEGLQALRRLESLSLAHNFLSVEALVKDGPLSSLKHLKRLDLSYNLLTSIPAVVFLLSNIETLVLVENNIQQLPNSLSVLKKLTTLCIDGNLLTEVDTALELVPQLKMVTMADNQFDMEPYCIKHQAYVITCVEGNPYIMNNGKHQDLHLKRTSSCVRGGVIKSQERTEIRRISAAFIDPPTSQQLDIISKISSQ